MTKIRTALISALVLFTTAGAGAQTPTRQPAPTPVVPGQLTPEAAAAHSNLDARATREQLRELMQRVPPDLGRILKLDPSLLQNQQYLGQYPALASFLAAHPEVAHNPSYFLEFVYLNRDEFQPSDSRSQAINMWRNMMEAVGVFCIFTLISVLVTWIVRTYIDYRRWLRISREIMSISPIRFSQISRKSWRRSPINSSGAGRAASRSRTITMNMSVGSRSVMRTSDTSGI